MVVIKQYKINEQIAIWANMQPCLYSFAWEKLQLQKAAKSTNYLNHKTIKGNNYQLQAIFPL